MPFVQPRGKKGPFNRKRVKTRRAPAVEKILRARVAKNKPGRGSKSGIAEKGGIAHWMPDFDGIVYYVQIIAHFSFFGDSLPQLIPEDTVSAEMDAVLLPRRSQQRKRPAI